MKVQLLSFALVSLLSFTSSAAQLSFDYGDSSPTLAAATTAHHPWLEADFIDVAPGVVNLTISAGRGPGAVQQVFFNLDPSLNPTDLVVTTLGTAGNFALPSIEAGLDEFKSDAGGKYDLKIRFGQGKDRFAGGDSITLQISGLPTLSADDFDFYSTPSASHGPLQSEALIMVQSAGWRWVGGNRGPASVPDGYPTALLLGTAVLALAAWTRSRSPAQVDQVRA